MFSYLTGLNCASDEERSRRKVVSIFISYVNTHELSEYIYTYIFSIL
jgi:hypothetical protein